jgi:hypothetical protein
MKTRIRKILARMDGISFVRKKFLTHIFVLFMSVLGRVNFLNMARYGSYCEKTYRTHFEADGDFFTFNRLLIDQTSTEHRIIAAACSFVPKSGHETPHLGTFWNGSISKAQKGLEISELAVVDVEMNTAFHLECLQTPGHLPDSESRIDFYAQHIIDRAAELKHMADYLVYDGAAAKQKFVDAIVEHTELPLISKLRKDANLRYLYTGPRRPGPGRPKCYDGKMDCQHPDFKRVETCYEDEHITIYTAIVNSPRLKRNIRIAYVQDTGSDEYVILFSTDVNLDGLLMDQYYKARFQIEFLFRDSKQYTGLTHCQARSEKKLAFHFNTSLTSVSVAKSEFYANLDNHDTPFSLHDIVTRHFNTRFLEQVFSKRSLDPKRPKIAAIYHELVNFGTIAA